MLRGSGTELLTRLLHRQSPCRLEFRLLPPMDVDLRSVYPAFMKCVGLMGTQMRVPP